MKLWDKGYTNNNIVDKFTVGNDRYWDLKLAKYDVIGNIAHVKMLHSIHLITDEECTDILNALSEIQTSVENETFEIEPEFEDIHSKIEFELIKKIGDAGKKIHSARSRNDQILVDLHLYTKEEIGGIKKAIKLLFNTLIELSNKHKSVIIPGYTHTQVAMPSSFGLWFSAYAECLIDDLIMLNAAFDVSDQNPLGSAAGYGSSFPIDRQMTTRLLNFGTMKYNVIAAQMSRGKLEKIMAFAISSLAGTLSKLSSDVCLFMSQNFNFLGFPKELTTGSSIMPHKRNPDVFEILRAKSNKIQNLPTEIIMITNNLTSGYHRDFQLLKGTYMEAIETTKDNLQVCNFMLKNVIIHDTTLNNSIYDSMYSVEAVNELVLTGVPFREAYKNISKSILSGKFIPNKKLRHTHQGSIGKLCLDEIQQKFKQIYDRV